MLQAIRERLIGWVLWAVIGFICVPFAFWGIESFRGGGGDPVLVKVGGRVGGLFGSERITESQLRVGYDRRYRQMQQLMGESFKPEQIKPAQFRELVLEDMIQDLTMRQYSDQRGYEAPGSVLVDSIRRMSAFQENGQFSNKVYQERLAREGYSPQRFESEMRNSLAIDQMRAGVVETTFATDADLAAYYRLAGQERTYDFALLSATKYRAAENPTDEQVKARYEQNKDRLTTPERVKLAYVELSLEKMPKAESPGPEVLKAVYEADKATRFSTPEERKARHILLAFGADKAAAKKHIDEVAAKLKAGGDFAETAKVESTDPGSKKQGGDLGWVKKGQMVPKFEEALFALKKGETSEPVESEFGWHLIRLDDIKPATIRAFEDKDVQAELLEQYQRKEAEKHFSEQQEKLEQLAFEKSGIEPVAEAMGLKVETTDWFGRAGAPTGVAANQAVKDIAFTDEILKNGDNSKPIQIATGDVVVVRKAEYEAPRTKALAEVAEPIRDRLREEAAKEKLKVDGRALQDAVRGGQKPEEATKKAGGEWKVGGTVKRDNTATDRAIMRTLFHIPRPQGDAPTPEQVFVQNGDLAVLFLTSVKDGDLQAAGADESKKLRAQLRDRDAGMEFNAFKGHIGDAIKVKRLKSAAEVTDDGATPQ